MVSAAPSACWRRASSRVTQVWWRDASTRCAALIFVTGFTFAGSWLLYKLTDLIIPLRVSDEQETLGLDRSQHGESIGEPYTVPAMKIA